MRPALVCLALVVGTALSQPIEETDVDFSSLNQAEGPTNSGLSSNLRGHPHPNEETSPSYTDSPQFLKSQTNNPTVQYGPLTNPFGSHRLIHSYTNCFITHLPPCPPTNNIVIPYPGKGFLLPPGYYPPGNGIFPTPDYGPPGNGLFPPPGYNPPCNGLFPPYGYGPPGNGLFPPPGYDPPGNGLFPPPGYDRPGNGLFPPPGYDRIGNGLFPPPGYDRPCNGLFPPPGYDRPGNGVIPPPGYDPPANDYILPNCPPHHGLLGLLMSTTNPTCTGVQSIFLSDKTPIGPAQGPPNSPVDRK